MSQEEHGISTVGTRNTSRGRRRTSIKLSRVDESVVSAFLRNTGPLMSSKSSIKQYEEETQQQLEQSLGAQRNLKAPSPLVPR